MQPAAAQERISASGDIPILAWYGIPAGQTSLARYEELKASGITYQFTNFPDAEAMAKALDIARKAGIKMIVACPELKTDTRNTVRRFMHHPAVAGYFLRDEPGKKDFPDLAEWAKKIQSVDKAHFCYLNLLPTYGAGALGTSTYREYVHTFIKTVPLQLLSFDHYPVVGDSLRWDWYDNLEVFSDEARKAGKPFWAFALTVSHGPYPIPTVAELKLQVFSDLAYGAQGIQYFTYWTPTGTQWDFHHGPITPEGKRSEIYDRIRTMNKEIKSLSGVFLGAKVVSVSHTGDSIPYGTKRLTTLPAPIKTLETKGKGAVVSVLKNGQNTFLVVVNRDFRQPMELTIHCDGGVKKVLKDGSLVPANAYLPTLEVDPGDMAVYQWTTP
ncbi:hypothetical protein GCM10023143_26500 [Compostibacter hankyongensis]|uniref:Glycoside hydrolase family 42 N-terminal domain-containing protein n=2 Tax=Compostibacter hankyongensis TaxID=1007089 RepID=A0ABP8G179_9BACT